MITPLERLRPLTGQARKSREERLSFIQMRGRRRSTSPQMCTRLMWISFPSAPANCTVRAALERFMWEGARISRQSLSAAHKRGDCARGRRRQRLPPGLRRGPPPLRAGRPKKRHRGGKLPPHLPHRLKKEIPGIVVNGDLKHSLPHMLNISIPDISSEYLILALDLAGISLSTKAACSEGEVGASHVVAALISDTEKKDWRSQNTLRFSLGRETKMKDVEYAVSTLVALLKTLPK